MDSSIIVKYNPQDAVPSDPQQRVEWLDRFGVLPNDAALMVVLPLRDWLRMGVTPEKDGRIDTYEYAASGAAKIKLEFERAALALVAETGQIVTELPATVLATVVSEVEARRAKAKAEADANAKAEADARARKLAEEMAAPIDAFLRRIGGLKDEGWSSRGIEFGHPRSREVEAEVRRRNEAEKGAFKAAIGEFVREHGTPDQAARHDAGVLPQSEVETLLREFVFRSMNLPRYERIRKADIDHGAVDTYDLHEVTFKTYEQGPLTAEQFAALEQIRKAAPKGAVIEVREHRGYCDEDSCPGSVRRLAALVTVRWHGKPLSREFALPGVPVDDE